MGIYCFLVDILSCIRAVCELEGAEFLSLLCLPVMNLHFSVVLQINFSFGSLIKWS